MIVKQYKLSNGDNVICEVLGFNEKMFSVIVQYPMKINEMYDQNNNMFYGFREWILYQGDAPQKIGINYNNVICDTVPHKDLLEQYHESRIKLKESYQREEMESIDYSFDSSYVPTHSIPKHLH